MYIPPGFWNNELGDIDVIVHDDVFHMFHLCIPSHDRVAHLTSSDGLNWAEAGTAITTGDPGEFDDDQIWTMGVCEFNGRFLMLYTGLCRKEQGKVQRVGLAVSDDLHTWTKHVGNPVACADPRWYEAEVDATMEAMTSLLGPVVILFMGGTVFVVAISLLLPMMSMSSMMR